MKVLLVEDTQAVAEVIFDYFEGSKVQLDYAANGLLGLSLALQGDFDCIILDIMLPGLDGLSICQQLRESGNNTPIIMLTARDTNADMLKGLKQGADDYIVKPFDLELLEARMEAVVRRSGNLGFQKQVSCGPLTIDVSRKQVWRSGQEIQLNPSTFKILAFMVEQHPNVATKQKIEELLWQDDLPDSDLLRKHIYQLRTKVDKPFEQELIITVPKVGYKLAVADEA
ncbi:MAG: DNA-binding response regulator [Colwelliaceae bacterium]|nr:DNA-binding response regulator [Colwelliaceae bacterium]